MGYYTHFELSNDKNISDKDIMYALAEINPGYFDFNDTIEDAFMESLKWYDHEHDMMELSKQFPDTIFTLKGEGEEHYDLWIDYYKNGKMQHCIGEVVYEPYNEVYFE